MQSQNDSFTALILHPDFVNNSLASKISDRQEVIGLGWDDPLRNEQALYWDYPSTTLRLGLAPNVESVACGIDGGQIGGSVWVSGQRETPQAAVWEVVPATTISLHPSNFQLSQVLGVSQGQFAGSGGGLSTSLLEHALLWTAPSASSLVDLNPTQLGVQISRAWDLDGTSGQQVGAGNHFVDLSHPGGNRFNVGVDTHALLWQGSAASAIDLHTPGFDETEALAVRDQAQVGYGIPSGSSRTHALLWHGTPESAIDLHPSGYDESRAVGTHGGTQVGFASSPSTGGEAHAIAWHGDPLDFIDLHPFLPADTQYSASYAADVDQFGNVVGSAVTSDGHTQAVVWRRIPTLAALEFREGTTVNGPRTIHMKVVLDGPAVGDTFVQLTTSLSWLIALPLNNSWFVPAGYQSAIIRLRVSPVTADRTDLITATVGGVDIGVTLAVVPVELSALSVTPSSVPGGAIATGTVFLDGLAPPSGALVLLSSSSPAASCPASVLVPPFADLASFPIRTASVGQFSFVAVITARYRGIQKSMDLQVSPPLP